MSEDVGRLGWGWGRGGCLAATQRPPGCERLTSGPPFNKVVFCISAVKRRDLKAAGQSSSSLIADFDAMVYLSFFFFFLLPCIWTQITNAWIQVFFFKLCVAHAENIDRKRRLKLLISRLERVDLIVADFISTPRRWKNQSYLSVILMGIVES